MDERRLVEAPGLVVFRLAGRSFGLALDRVREIVRMVAVTAMPEAPLWLVGVMNLRGDHIPLIELRARLGLDPAAPDVTSRIIVVDALDRTAGLVVDEVAEVLPEAPGVLETFEGLAGDHHPVLGITRLDTMTVVILDVDEITTGTQDLDLPEGLDGLV